MSTNIELMCHFEWFFNTAVKSKLKLSLANGGKTDLTSSIQIIYKICKNSGIEFIFFPG